MNNDPHAFDLTFSDVHAAAQDVVEAARTGGFHAVVLTCVLSRTGEARLDVTFPRGLMAKEELIKTCKNMGELAAEFVRDSVPEDGS